MRLHRSRVMDSDLMPVSAADLVLSTHHSVDQSSGVVGLHVLTTDYVPSSESMIGELSSDACGRSVIAIPALSADISSSVVEKAGEITLNSAFIPENAVLMETPRGLMLTVPEGISGISYVDDNSSCDSSHQVLSCIPVSLFSHTTPDGDEEAGTVYGEDISNDTETNESPAQLTDNTDGQLKVEHTDDHTHLPDLDDGKSKFNSSINVSTSDQTMALTEETAQVSVTAISQKRKGGWPKGKKRKVQPAVTGPRPPVTGYVLYAMDRRKEIKESHPEITFPEVTKILGQEWSTMAADVKEKYLAAAEADKKRYRQELKAFRSSEECVRRKMAAANTEKTSPTQESTDILNCGEEEGASELYCKVCNIYFNNLHNKREHMYGKVHITNVTGVVEKELLRQQREDHQFMESNLVVSEDLSQENFPSALRANGSTCCTCNSTNSASSSSGPVDIHGFMMEFIQKNFEREHEISVLKKCLNKELQDNMTMCKQIQDLQELQTKLDEDLKSLTSTTASLLAQTDALKMVPTLFGIVNL